MVVNGLNSVSGDRCSGGKREVEFSATRNAFTRDSGDIVTILERNVRPFESLAPTHDERRVPAHTLPTRVDLKEKRTREWQETRR
jgi:hypothetical protein